VLFAALGFAGIMHHEIWLDEAHHFLLGRDSASVSEMAFHARYEGHPLLWNVLLFVLTRFSSDPFAMQLLNLVIAAVAVLLFLRHAPFHICVKSVIVFSYFIFYEYTVLSRNYALSFLLMVIVCIVFRERKKHFLWLALALALLAQTHLFAALIAGGMALLLAHEFIFSKVRVPALPFAAGMFLLLGALAFVVVQVIPPADHFLYTYDQDKYTSFKRIGKAFSVLWKGLFPLPDMGNAHPWNSNLFISISKNLSVIPAVLAWLVPAILIVRKRPVLLFFYASALCIVVFIFFSPLIVASRHCGFFFLLLLMALWIAEFFPAENRSGVLTNAWQRFAGKFSKSLFVVLLLVQLTGGIYLFVVDLRRPFSHAKHVAEWLSANKQPSDIIIVNDQSTGPAIAAYMQSSVYYAETNAEGSFCQWNVRPFILSQDTLLARIAALSDAHPGQRILLVSCRRITLAAGNPFLLKPLQSFDGALVRSENYVIYEIREW
jgi:hypothetical protein